jgi:hypothetical protein
MSQTYGTSTFPVSSSHQQDAQEYLEIAHATIPLQYGELAAPDLDSEDSRETPNQGDQHSAHLAPNVGQREGGEAYSDSGHDVYSVDARYTSTFLHDPLEPSQSAPSAGPSRFPRCLPDNFEYTDSLTSSTPTPLDGNIDSTHLISTTSYPYPLEPSSRDLTLRHDSEPPRSYLSGFPSYVHPPAPIRSDPQTIWRDTGQANPRRLVIACHFCRMRKLKCDGERPCRHCERRQKVCTYEETIKKRGKGRKKKGEGRQRGDSVSEFEPPPQSAYQDKNEAEEREREAGDGTSLS